MNLIFNKKLKAYNLDKFEQGHENKLLIVGFSGSGKTTLAKKLAEKYHAKYISLDDFFFQNITLKKENPEKYELLRKEFENKHLFSNEKMIIEGVGILKRTDDKTLSLPIIVIGTSFLNSIVRGTIRNLKNPLKEKSFLSEAFVVIDKNWNKYYMNLENFTKELDKRYEGNTVKFNF